MNKKQNIKIRYYHRLLFTIGVRYTCSQHTHNDEVHCLWHNVILIARRWFNASVYTNVASVGITSRHWIVNGRVFGGERMCARVSDKQWIYTYHVIDGGHVMWPVMWPTESTGWFWWTFWARGPPLYFRFWSIKTVPALLFFFLMAVET